MPVENSLDIFSGLTKWGEVRLHPKHLENTITVEVKRVGREEQFKPLFTFTVVNDRLAFRVEAEHNSRVVVYDPKTGQFSDLAGNQADRRSET